MLSRSVGSARFLSILGIAILIQLSTALPGLAGQRTGTLTITSDPAGAEVMIDGRAAGRTPVSLATLPTGDHRVRLVKEGFVENARVVTIGGSKPATLHVALTGRAGKGTQNPTPQPQERTLADPVPLKIVVVDGQEAANIVADKMAAEPVVEVRDRENRRVPGAVVRFAIKRGLRGDQVPATFANGQAEVTVVTDAAGRAAGGQLTPVSEGAFEIEVQATHQGQTATATIRHTNYQTAAEAREARRVSSQGSGAAGAAGAAAAAGGGVSKLLIAGLAVGGAAGGAAVIARTRDANKEPRVTAVTASSTVGLQGATAVTFSAEANDPDNDTLTYRWEFGDGTSSTEARPTHVYNASGTYLAKATVSDGKGATTSHTNVTIKSLTGTWRSGPMLIFVFNPAGALVRTFPGVVVMTLTQSGTAITGTFVTEVSAEEGGPDLGTMTGSVNTASPAISLAGRSISGRIGDLVMSLQPSSDVNTLTGSTVLQPITFTRQ